MSGENLDDFAQRFWNEIGFSDANPVIDVPEELDMDYSLLDEQKNRQIIFNDKLENYSPLENTGIAYMPFEETEFSPRYEVGFGEISDLIDEGKRAEKKDNYMGMIIATVIDANSNTVAVANFYFSDKFHSVDAEYMAHVNYAIERMKLITKIEISNSNSI
jgi:hypothetical protein